MADIGTEKQTVFIRSPRLFLGHRCMQFTCSAHVCVMIDCIIYYDIHIVLLRRRSLASHTRYTENTRLCVTNIHYIIIIILCTINTCMHNIILPGAYAYGVEWHTICVQCVCTNDDSVDFTCYKFSFAFTC